MVGRGLRLSPDTGKNDCLLLDIVDSVAQAGGMQVSPTLLGLSYEDGAEDERPKRDRGNDSPPVHTSKC
jgi:ATP-dependent helicase IRC3